MFPYRFKKPKIDIILALAVFILVAFGLIMISSASAVISYENFGYNNYYLFRQIIFLAIGLVGWIVAQNIDYHFWKKIAFPALAITIFLNILVFLPGIGFSYGGSTRWINLGFFLLQPSEILKLSLIIYLASWFDERRREIFSTRKIFLPFCFLLIVVAAIMLKQPDMGTFIIIIVVAFLMYFVAGARIFHLLLISAGGVSAVYFLIKAAPYRMARLLAFLNPEKDPLGIGFHINQALIAVGSGGLLGRGFGKSGQKYTGYIPEAAGDSIFAIIAEELGFIKILIFPIAFFIIFAWRGFRVARRAPDFLGKLMAFGITSWIVFQAAMNIATMLALVPLTGITLPFISYGGSSLIMILISVGILLNISKHRME